MFVRRIRKILLVYFDFCCSAGHQGASDAATPIYLKFKAYLDSISAIDTHDHLFPFDHLQNYSVTSNGPGMNLFSIFKRELLSGEQPYNALEARWVVRSMVGTGKYDFKNARATSFYRYLLPAFQDLYGIAFDNLTDGPGTSARLPYIR